MEERSYYKAPYRIGLGRGRCGLRPEERGRLHNGGTDMYTSLNDEESVALGYRTLEVPIYAGTGEDTGNKKGNRNGTSAGYDERRNLSYGEVDPHNHTSCNHYHLHLHHHHIHTDPIPLHSEQTPLEEEEPFNHFHQHYYAADHHTPLPHGGPYPYHSNQRQQYSSSTAPPQRTGLNTMEEPLTRPQSSAPGGGRKPSSGDRARLSACRRDKLKKIGLKRVGSTEDDRRPHRRSGDSLEEQTLEKRSPVEFGSGWEAESSAVWPEVTVVGGLEEPNKCSTPPYSSSRERQHSSRQVIDTAPGSCCSSRQPCSTGVLNLQEEVKEAGAPGEVGASTACRGTTPGTASGDTSPVFHPRLQQEETTWRSSGTGGGPPISPGAPGSIGDYPLSLTPPTHHSRSSPGEAPSCRTSGRAALEQDAVPCSAVPHSSLSRPSLSADASASGGAKDHHGQHPGGARGWGRGCIHGNNGNSGNNGGHHGHYVNTGDVGLSADVERRITTGSLMEVSPGEQSPPGGVCTLGGGGRGGSGNCHYSRVEDMSGGGEVDGVGCRRGRLLSAPPVAGEDDTDHYDDHHPPPSPRRYRTDRSHSAPGGGLLLTTGVTSGAGNTNTTTAKHPKYHQLEQQPTPPISPLTLSPPPSQDHYPPSTGSSSQNHVNPSSRGGYSSIPVVRVQLADDGSGGGENDDAANDGFRCATSAANTNTVLEDDDDRRSTRSYMEEDGESGVGGLQAIDLEELHRRRKQRRKRKWKFAKNTLILSIAFVFLFSCTSGLTLLQSSLNRQMGVFSLCANFTAIAVSCLLLPKALIQLLGCKWTIVASMACFMLWIMSNLHPTWATLIPSAVVMGTGWAPLWTAQCTYFTVTGIEYAKWGDDMPDVVIARMFGIFFMIFMTAPIWGNLLSSSVLSTGVYNRTRALPLPGDPESIYRFCGAADCPGIYENSTDRNENYNRPENSLVYTLISIYLGLSLIGLTLVAFFLDSLELDREAGKPRCVPVSIAASFKQMANPYQVFIIPLTVYTGMEQVFLMVEYTRAYATCALGMEKIGYVVSSYAALAALMSLACSQLVNVVGRMPLFLIGAGAHIGCMVVFMRWTPYPDSLVMFIVMPAIWGIGDAIWQSQINAFYGVLFSDQSEAAFSNYRMWESVGFIMSLSYSPFMCVFRKIHILLGVLIAGILGYFVVEGLYSKASSERETELAKKGVLVEAESAAAEEEEGAFGGVAQMMRRKSTVYLPQRTVREAAEVMRRKSQVFLGGIDNPDRVIRRRLSTFAPVMEVTEDSTPLSSAPSTPGTQRSPAVTSLITSDDVNAGSGGAGGLVQHRKSEPEVDVRGHARRNGRVTPPKLKVAKRQHFDV